MTKMTYVTESGTVLYQSKLGHGKNELNFELFAAITQHILPKSYQMVRYYGWYSNRARGERKKRGMLRPGNEPEEGRSDDVTVLDVSDYDPPRLTSKTWRQLIYKVWEVDPLVCTRCGAEMKVIVLIDDPAVIRRSHTLNIQSFTQYSLPSAPCPMLHALCLIFPPSAFPIPPSIHSRNSIAGGCRKTILIAGRAAARAVRIIKGSDIPSAPQSTPYKNVQPNDCLLITYTSR